MRFIIQVCGEECAFLTATLMNLLLIQPVVKWGILIQKPLKVCLVPCGSRSQRCIKCCSLTLQKSPISCASGNYVFIQCTFNIAFRNKTKYSSGGDGFCEMQGICPNAHLFKLAITIVIVISLIVIIAVLIFLCLLLDAIMCFIQVEAGEVLRLFI